MEIIGRHRDENALRTAEVQHQHGQAADEQRNGQDAGKAGEGFVIRRLKTDDTEATLSAPEAETIRKTAKTWGVPHTIWLLMPVTPWPCVSI